MVKGYYLAKMLSCLPSLYERMQGIVNVTSLPNYIKKNCFIIVNKSTETRSGHWFSIFHNGHTKSLEGFDPLGFDFPFYQKYFPYNRKIIFNETRFQSLKSNRCGQFTVIFLMERLFNMDLSFFEVLSIMFTDKVLKNERKIRREEKRILNGQDGSPIYNVRN